MFLRLYGALVGFVPRVCFELRFFQPYDLELSLGVCLLSALSYICFFQPYDRMDPA